jgi:putative mRNA 3-end processing factor
VPAIVAAIREWWLAAPQRASILFCYALGKTQRVLAELARLEARPVYLHADALKVTDVYRRAGVRMVPTINVATVPKGQPLAGELIIAPPTAAGTRWMRRFPDAQTAFVSGWMQDASRKGPYDRGFALSDHADWLQLVATVRESRARVVYVTHGECLTFARHLREALGIDARPLVPASPARPA